MRKKLILAVIAAMLFACPVLGDDTATPTPSDIATLTMTPTVTATELQCVAGHKILFISGTYGSSSEDIYRYIYTMNEDGTGRVSLTGNIQEVYNARFSQDWQKIVYESTMSGNYEIYTMDADGSNVVKLTNISAADYMPSFSPDRTKIVFVSQRSGNGEIYTMDSDGSNVVNLTNNSAYDYYPEYSWDGTKIIFESDRTGGGDIYMMNTDGTGLTRITDNPAAEHMPFLSPDGSKLAFVSTRGGGNPDIYVRDLGTGVETRLTYSNSSLGEECDYPRYSGDGNKMLYQKNTSNEGFKAYEMNADGTGQTQISPHGDIEMDTNPSWGQPYCIPYTQTATLTVTASSVPTETPTPTQTATQTEIETATFTQTFTATPEMTATVTATELQCVAGHKILFITGTYGSSSQDIYRYIYTMNEDGTGRVSLTGNIQAVFNARFSYDWQKIVYSSNISGNVEIYIMDADGSNVVNISNNSAADSSPSFSPDRTKIVFMSQRSGGGDIFTMNTDGSNVVDLTNNSSYDYYPEYSWDGTKIVFVSYRSGGGDIYMMNTDGTGVTQVTNAPELDKMPFLSPDGSKMAFVSTRGGGNPDIYVRDLGTGVETRLTYSNSSLGEECDYPRYSADGNKILYQKNTSDEGFKAYEMNADGTGQTQISPHNDTDKDTNPSWGPPYCIAYTQTATITDTDTPELTVTPTVTPTITPTVTMTVTVTPTVTPTITSTATYTSTYNWPADVMAVYLLNNNYADDTGNYTDLAQGGSSGGSFSTDHYYDSYSWHNDINNNYRIFPVALETALSGKSQFTIQFWTDVPVQQAIWPYSEVYLSRGNGSWPPAQGSLLLQYSSSSTWSPNSAAIWFDDSYTANSPLTPEYSTGWHLISLEWDGSVFTFYKDGVACLSLNENINPFATTGFNGTFYLGTLFGGVYPDYYDYYIQNGIQRVIFSGGIMGGVEITPLQLFTATSTPTITNTSTSTATASPTSTPTATFTDSRVNTATYTATQTVTPTITGTVTDTDTDTCTMTETITPTYTISPTVTVTPQWLAAMTVSKNTVIIGEVFTIWINGFFSGDAHSGLALSIPTSVATPGFVPTPVRYPSGILDYIYWFYSDSTSNRNGTYYDQVTITASLAGSGQLMGWYRDIGWPGDFPLSNEVKINMVVNSVTPTITQEMTRTITQTMTDTFTLTETMTATPTMTPTVTETRTATATETILLTATNTVTPTIPSTFTQTLTQTGTLTITGTITPTVTETATGTATRTLTGTRTTTATFTATPTVSVSLTVSVTNTGTPIIEWSQSITPTFSRTGTVPLTFTATATATPTGYINVTYTNGNSGFVDGGTNIFFTVNNTTKNGVMLVGISGNNTGIWSNPPISAISYAGTNMTFITYARRYDNFELDIYKVVSPKAGTNWVSITFTASNYAMAQALIYDNTGAVGVYGANEGYPVSYQSVTLTSTMPNSVFVAFGGIRDSIANLSAGPNWTARLYQSNANDRGLLSFDRFAPNKGNYIPNFRNGSAGDMGLGGVELLVLTGTPTITRTITPTSTITPTFTNSPTITASPTGYIYVTYTNGNSGTVDGGTNIFFTVNNTTKNGVMLVGISGNNTRPSGSSPVSAISYAGANMTLLTKAFRPGNLELDIYKLVSPKAGTNWVSITFTASNYAMAQALIYDNTGAVGVYASNEGYPVSYRSITITSTMPNSLFVAFGGVRASAVNLSAGPSWAARLYQSNAFDRGLLSFDRFAPVVGNYIPNFRNGTTTGDMGIGGVELFVLTGTPTITRTITPTSTTTPTFTVTSTVTASPTGYIYVTYANGNSGSTDGGTNIFFTVGNTAQNSVMLVGISGNNTGSPGTPPISAISYAGDNMTFLTRASRPGSRRMELDIYKLVSPKAGTNWVSITFTASNYAMAQALIYDNTGAVGAYDSNSGSGSYYRSITITSTMPKSMFVAFGGVRAGAVNLSSGPGWTTRLYQSNANDRGLLSFDRFAATVGNYIPNFRNGTTTGSMGLGGVELLAITNTSTITRTITPTLTATPTITQTSTIAVSDVVLSSSSGLNMNIDYLTVAYNSNAPVNIIDWRLSAVSIGLLDMPFEGGTTGTTARDYSTYNRVVTKSGTGSISYVKTGGVGNNGYANFSKPAYYNIGNLGAFPAKGTISFWIKPSAIENYNNALCTNFSGANGNSGIRFEEAVSTVPGSSGSGSFVVAIGNDTGTFSGHTYLSSGLNTSTWRHIVLVWDKAANNVKGYLDKNLVFDHNQTLWATTMPDVKIGIGFNSARSWAGGIDEVMIYNRAMSVQQVSELYYYTRTKIVPQELKTGDIWTAAVIPNNYFVDGATVISNALTIISPTITSTSTVTPTISPTRTPRTNGIIQRQGVSSASCGTASDTVLYPINISNGYISPYLFVVINTEGTDGIPSNVQYNGIPMAMLGSVSDAGAYSTYMYYMPDPPTGAPYYFAANLSNPKYWISYAEVYSEVSGIGEPVYNVEGPSYSHSIVVYTTKENSFVLGNAADYGVMYNVSGYDETLARQNTCRSLYGTLYDRIATDIGPYGITLTSSTGMAGMAQIGVELKCWDSPTFTPTITETYTLTATETLPGSKTVTPTITMTATLTFTSTNSPVLPATSTFTPTANTGVFYTGGASYSTVGSSNTLYFKVNNTAKNGVMLVGISGNNTGGAVGAISYAGINMTFLTRVYRTNNFELDVYKLVTPRAGTNGVSITFTASNWAIAEALIYDNTGNVGAFNSVRGFPATSQSMNISSTIPNSVFVGFGGVRSSNAKPTPGTGWTPRLSNYDYSDRALISFDMFAPTVGIYTPNFNNGTTTGDLGLGAVEILLITATTTPILTKTTTPTITQTPTIITVLGVNCAGNFYRSGTTSLEYSADQPFTGINQWGYVGANNTYVPTPARNIGNTSDDILYQSQRTGVGSNIEYRFRVKNGVYRVTSKFAEINYTQSMKRSVGYQIESAALWGDKDILAEAGGADTAWDYTADMMVNDGQLNIFYKVGASTTPGVDKNPVVNAIYIELLGSPTVTFTRTQTYAGTSTFTATPTITSTLTPSVTQSSTLTSTLTYTYTYTQTDTPVCTPTNTPYFSTSIYTDHPGDWYVGDRVLVSIAWSITGNNEEFSFLTLNSRNVAEYQPAGYSSGLSPSGTTNNANQPSVWWYVPYGTNLSGTYSYYYDVTCTGSGSFQLQAYMNKSSGGPLCVSTDAVHVIVAATPTPTLAATPVDTPVYSSVIYTDHPNDWVLGDTVNIFIAWSNKDFLASKLISSNAPGYTPVGYVSNAHEAVVLDQYKPNLFWNLNVEPHLLVSVDGPVVDGPGAGAHTEGVYTYSYTVRQIGTGYFRLESYYSKLSGEIFGINYDAVHRIVTATMTITPTYSNTMTPSATETYTGTDTATNTPTITSTNTPDISPSQKMHLVSIKYKPGTATANVINPIFRLYNKGSEDLDLSKVKVRYWYSDEGTGGEDETIDSSVRYNNFDPTPTHTDIKASTGHELITKVLYGLNYRALDIMFGAGAGLLHPGDYVEVAGRINKSSGNYDQSDDWSYGSDASNYNDSGVMTVYYDYDSGDEREIYGQEPQDPTFMTYSQKVDCGGSGDTGTKQDRIYAYGGWGQANYASSVYNYSQPIYGAGADEQYVYQSSIIGNESKPISYIFDNTPSGTYHLIFKFAEIRPGITAGKDVMNIYIDGVKKFSNVDVYASAGFARKYIIETNVEVTGGQMRVSFEGCGMAGFEVSLTNPLGIGYRRGPSPITIMQATLEPDICGGYVTPVTPPTPTITVTPRWSSSISVSTNVAVTNEPFTIWLNGYFRGSGFAGFRISGFNASETPVFPTYVPTYLPTTAPSSEPMSVTSPNPTPFGGGAIATPGNFYFYSANSTVRNGEFFDQVTITARIAYPRVFTASYRGQSPEYPLLSNETAVYVVVVTPTITPTHTVSPTITPTCVLVLRQIGDQAISTAQAIKESLFIYNGTLYVAYVDYSQSMRLVVRKYEGTNWVNVGTGPVSFGQADGISLYVYDGIPYVSYKDYSMANWPITVKKFDGNNWTIVGGASFSDGEVYDTSIFVYKGIPYVAYTDAAHNLKATVSKFVGDHWINLGGKGFTFAGDISICVYKGTPYIAFADGTALPGGVSVMKYNGGSWSYVGNPRFSGEAEYISFSFDSNGIPYVAYSSYPGFLATVKKYDGGDWVNVGNPGFSGGAVNFISLFMYNETPYLAYTDQNNGNKATVSKFDGSDWVRLGTNSGSSAHTSLYVYNGVPYVAYYGNDWKAYAAKLDCP